MRAEPQSLLIVIGMMGSGKSTIGRQLARQLKLGFIDSDRALEERSGVPVATIFELEGELGFRNREAALLDDLTQRKNLLIATGGGAVLLEENRQRMRSRGLVIYLEATLEELQRRLRHDKSRPLLQGVDIERRVAELLAARAPLYRQCAHVTFPSGAANPKRLVQRILDSPEVKAAISER